MIGKEALAQMEARVNAAVEAYPLPWHWNNWSLTTQSEPMFRQEGAQSLLTELCPESSANWIMVAVVGPCGQRAALSTRAIVGASGRHAQGLLLVLAQVIHVEVTVRFQPVLVHLDRERPDQA